MSSTILYKFRASSTFEALPLPGSAARLFDVKKAIVKANKLDAGSMEFDLAVRNADTNEEYADESMLLPRGTRIIVQRLPAARGHGFLARMARNEHGGGGGNSYQQQQQQHPSGYYTIDNQARENEEEEFVDGATTAENNDDKELAALQAVTSMRPDGGTSMGGGRPTMMGGHRGGRGGPPQPAGMGAPPGGSKPNFHHQSNNNNKPNGNSNHFQRPNADPELREQEKKLMPKKRATGIPRTFLNLSAPPQTDGSKGEGGESEHQTPLLQPNKQGFKELVSRGGGQSERTAGTRRDLDYVLKLTSTNVPEHLQCAICNTVVKNAMLLPWDSEGRTVCETCIRDALTQNGFRCPLTGMDGVSPDDLIPNRGLRKAVDMFIKGVMEKVDEIEQQQVEELVQTTEDTTAQSSERNVLDGEGAEKGVLVSKRMSLSNRKKSDDDPFGGGGDDDFGGDVFAVEAKNETAEEPEATTEQKKEVENVDAASKVDTAVAKDSTAENKEETKSNEPSKDTTDAVGSDNVSSSKIQSSSNKEDTNKQNDETNEVMTSTDSSTLQTNNVVDHSSKPSIENKVQKSPKPAPPPPPPPPSSHMRFQRRRGPPVGYAMGAAGGAVASARANNQSNNNNNNNNYHGNNNGQDYSSNNNNHQGGRGDYNNSNNNHQGGRGGGRFSPRGGGGGRHGNFHQDRNDGRGSYGRGRGGRGRGQGRGRGRGNTMFDGDQQVHQNMDDDNIRGTKRGRDGQQEDEGGDGQQHWDRGGRGNFRNDGGRGSYGRGGRNDGGRGSYGRGGRGGGGRSWDGQQRGNGRGGRGNYGGRGRY